MKKTVKLCALLLILVLLPSMFLGSCGIFEQYEFESSGMNHPNYNYPPGGVRSEKAVLDKDCAEVEFCYAFYDNNGKGMELYNQEVGYAAYPEGYHKPFYALYITNGEAGSISEGEYTDYKSIEGYTYLKTISNEEILSDKYSYDPVDIFGIDLSFLFGFSYDHSEIIQLPQEFLENDESYISIIAVLFFESVEDETDYYCVLVPRLAVAIHFENIDGERIRLTH